MNQKAIQAIVAGVTQSVTPSFVRLALVIAIAEANQQVPELFQRCEYWGKESSTQFLRQTFAEAAISELRKPLECKLKPDVTVLKLAFAQALSNYSGKGAVVVEALEDWLKVFAKEYFQRITQPESSNASPWARDCAEKLYPEQAAAQQLALLSSDDDAVRSRAAEYLGRLGQNAEPIIDSLLALLQDQSEKVRDAAIIALLKLEYLSDVVVNDALTASDWRVRCDAAIALGQQGHASEQVVDALITLLDDDFNNVRALAAGSLGFLDHPSEQKIIGALRSKGLKDHSAWVSVYAAKSLVQLDQASEDIVEELIRYLGFYHYPDEGEIVRDCAADTLGYLVHDSERVIDALFECLKDSDKDVYTPVCTAAISSLVRLAHAADGAMDRVVNGLLALLTDEGIELQDDFEDMFYDPISYTLVKLAQHSEAAVDGLLALLNYDNADVRYSIVLALGSLSHPSDAVVGYLLALLNDSDEDIRYCATESLGKLGIKSPAVVDGLLARLKDDDADVRDCAASSLQKLGEVPFSQS